MADPTCPPHRRGALVLVVSLGAFLAAASAGAQTADVPDADARVRFGPLSMNPTFALVNLGEDTNVYNQPDSANPKRDFTMTLRPATDLWLHVGRAWLTGRVQEDLVYFRDNTAERSANQLYRGGIVAPLGGMRFIANTSYLDTRDRPGYEIDARARRQEVGFDGSAEVRISPSTFVGVRGERRRIRYDAGQSYLGTDLRETLDETTDTEAVTVRHALTPMTTVVFEGGVQHDRFTFAPSRNAVSDRAAVSLQFDPEALIKGTATVGYRNFKPDSPTLPKFSGVTSTLNLSYVAFGATRFTVEFARDLQYSYDLTQPYYLETGGTATFTQQIYGPVELVVRGGLRQLQYRDDAALVSVAERTDRLEMYGGGIGYRLGKDVRLGLNADQQRRLSALPQHQYSGLRFGISVTYGS